MGTTLLVLASLAAVGALAAGALPRRTKTTGAPQQPTATGQDGREPTGVITTMAAD
ncbi:hypothetical protein ACGFWI_05280 [Streptomyces sp. NPDC048434]|uniref:hypothetical protein n=1 Tax=Streptomyces sp. NPDC048434 TaxID=3365549 RepID=UPI00372373E0